VTRKLLPFGCACLLLPVFFATGCAKPIETRVTDFDPYTGPRPNPIRPLPEPPPSVKPTKPRVAAAGAEGGWMPPGGISNRWECIVVHHSGSDRSTPQSMREWHMKGRGWDELGYHFVIGNGAGYGDGQVYVGERWRKQMHGAHCKTPGNHYNDHGIGICLIGDLDAHGPTRKQIESLARLSSFLTQQCGISQSHVLTHGGITHKTACPGRYFSLSPVFKQMTLRSADASDAEDDGLDLGTQE
jgi:hypothetical protein